MFCCCGEPGDSDSESFQQKRRTTGSTQPTDSVTATSLSEVTTPTHLVSRKEGSSPSQEQEVSVKDCSSLSQEQEVSVKDCSSLSQEQEVNNKEGSSPVEEQEVSVSERLSSGSKDSPGKGPSEGVSEENITPAFVGVEETAIERKESQGEERQNVEVTYKVVEDIQKEQELDLQQAQEELEKVLEQAKTEDDEMASEALTSAVNRLEAVASRLEVLALKTPSTGKAPCTEPDVVAPYVQAFDNLLKGEFAKFQELSDKIGGDVQAMCDSVTKTFNAKREFLNLASKCKKPDNNVLTKLLQPTSSGMQEIIEFRESRRKSPQINHLSTISESIPGLGWISISPTPGPYLKDFIDAGVFYSNRILKEFREKDPVQVDWVKSWSAIFRELQAYIKEYHTTGVSWNPRGVDASSLSAAPPAAPPAPPAGGPPPPPPPPPVEPPTGTPTLAPSADNDEGREALFSALNQGTEITKGLKKVSDKMKTHKNPALRQGPAPYKSTVKAPPKTAPKPSIKPTAPAAKAPVFELQNGKKWVIENHIDNPSIVIDDTSLQQTVYIYKCQRSTIQVKGKINSIIVDSCKKVGVVFDDLVSSLEFINCQSVKGQVIGKMPTVSIDKTDGAQIYLSEASLKADIVSAKSSEMNIVIPKDGDFVEFALPEQFKTAFDGKKMVTICSDI